MAPDRPRHPWLRGLICGAMTALGGIGHTLPYLIHNFNLATTIAIIVVPIELATITWLRNRYMDTPPLSAALQVAFGGALVFRDRHPDWEFVSADVCRPFVGELSSSYSCQTERSETGAAAPGWRIPVVSRLEMNHVISQWRQVARASFAQGAGEKAYLGVEAERRAEREQNAG